MLRCIILTSLFLLAFCRPPTSYSEERLIGWKGEQIEYSESKATERVTQKPWVETVAWSPRAFVYHNFLTDEECEHFKDLARPNLKRSLVATKNSGSSTDSIRTSYSTRLWDGSSDVVTIVADRIAKWTHLPVENGEPFEVLRYVDGQKYDAHWDWFENPSRYNRVATVLMYLSGVPDHGGGETALPLADPLDPVRQSVTGLSACANRSGISVVPRKGDALLFWDMLPDSITTDRRALHASCPTFKGEKWTATRWIHMAP